MLKAIADSYTNVPDGFTVHPKVLPQLQRRAASITAGPIDWGTGEIIAMGSLLADGRPVRLSGQDTRRGTFTSRFATIIDRVNADEWTPLSHVAEDQATFYVYDSLLSEYAALGFEYGYSVARPEALTMWEAQFGDFINGAQSVVDEYISSGETKWGQKSGVVLLLPHGQEGQGPDHSSARIERFLELCADNAMTIAQPSTPASYFHLLRRQNLESEHRPLIVFTPKSMLRNKAATSQPEDFTSGTFRPVIGDDSVTADSVERVLVCSGKIYWDLVAERAKRRGRASPVRRSSASSRSTRARPPSSTPRSRSSPTLARSAGSRRSRPTRARGRTSRCTSVASSTDFRCRVSRVRSRRLPRSARTSATSRSRPTWCSAPSPDAMYFTDRGIEELANRRGDEEVTFAWLAERLVEFVDLNPDFEVPVERLATWLARLDDDDE